MEEALHPAASAASPAARQLSAEGHLERSGGGGRRSARRWRDAERSAAASLAAGGRRAGSRQRARSTTLIRSGGRSGRIVRSDGAPSSILRAVSIGEEAQNGCRPASASQSRTPTAQ